MNIEKAKMQLKRTYREHLIRIGLARRVADALEPLLPRGWQCELSTTQGLEIYPVNRYEKKHAAEFRMVCDMVEKIAHVPVKREAVDSDRLQGEAYIYEYKHFRKRYLLISVYSNVDESCHIEKREKIRVIYEASPACLGIHTKEVK